MEPKSSRLLSLGVATALIAGCGGGSSGSAPHLSSTPSAQTGNVSMLISDASTDDWATIGVKVLSIALVPQGGGSNVTVYTAPSTAPLVNLAELDQIAELLGNSAVPVGTYTAAVLTVSANSGDVLIDGGGESRTGLYRSGRDDHSQRSHSGAARAGHCSESHSAGQRDLCIAAGRDRRPK
jgi:hypothetical protein